MPVLLERLGNERGCVEEMIVVGRISVREAEEGLGDIFSER